MQTRHADAVDKVYFAAKKGRSHLPALGSATQKPYSLLVQLTGPEQGKTCNVTAAAPGHACGVTADSVNDADIAPAASSLGIDRCPFLQPIRSHFNPF